VPRYGRSGALRVPNLADLRSTTAHHDARRKGGCCCRRPRGGTGATRALDAERSDHAEEPISPRRSSSCPGAAVLMRAAQIGQRSSAGIASGSPRIRTTTAMADPTAPSTASERIGGKRLARRNSVGVWRLRLLVGGQAPPQTPARGQRPKHANGRHLLQSPAFPTSPHGIETSSAARRTWRRSVVGTRRCGCGDVGRSAAAAAAEPAAKAPVGTGSGYMNWSSNTVRRLGTICSVTFAWYFTNLVL
jgi:hypothetical protein